MTKKVPLDRLRELAKHRSLREPFPVWEEPAQAIVVDPEPDILIWPIPRPAPFRPS